MIDGVRREEQFRRRHAEFLEIRPVGLAHISDGGELPVQQTPEPCAGPGGRGPPQKMRVAAKHERHAVPLRPKERSQVTGVGVTKEEQGVGPPGGKPGGQGGIAQPPEMIGTRPRRPVGHEFRVIAGKQINIPGKRGAEARIAPGLDAELPEIEDVEREFRMRPQPAKPRTIVLRRVGKDNGKPAPGRKRMEVVSHGEISSE